MPPRDSWPADESPEPPPAGSPPVRRSDSELDTWIRRHERPLIAYAAGMLGGDWGAARDAVQETFLRLCRLDSDKRASLGSVDGRIAAWLFSVCRTRVIDMRRLKSPAPADPQTLAVPDTADTPDCRAIRQEQSQTLARRIETLTDRQREVIRLRFSGGLSYREIADVTGMTVNNVGFHLHAAIARLRREVVHE